MFSHSQGISLRPNISVRKNFFCFSVLKRVSYLAEKKGVANHTNSLSLSHTHISEVESQGRGETRLLSPDAGCIRADASQVLWWLPGWPGGCDECQKRQQKRPRRMSCLFNNTYIFAELVSYLTIIAHHYRRRRRYEATTTTTTLTRLTGIMISACASLTNVCMLNANSKQQRWERLCPGLHWKLARRRQAAEGKYAESHDEMPGSLFGRVCFMSQQ